MAKVIRNRQFLTTMSDIDNVESSALLELESGRSYEDEDDIAPSDSPFSSVSPTPDPLTPLFISRKRPGRHAPAKRAWQHAREPMPWEDVRNKHKQRLFYCKHCRWSDTVSNALSHLKNHHGILISKPTNNTSLRKQAHKNAIKAGFSIQEQRAQKTMDKNVKNVLLSAFNKDRYEDAVARLIARGSLHHRVIELPEWSAVIAAVNWTAVEHINTSHQSIPPRLQSNFEREQLLIKEHLRRSISCIHLCTDSWYAGRSLQKEFQGINAQWVTPEGRLQKALLCLPALAEGHAGSEVAPHIIKALQFYEIEDRLGWITGDNHGANDTLCRELEEHFNSKDIHWWSASQRRLRCFGHVANLITHAFLYAKDIEAVELALGRAANSQSQTMDEAIALLSTVDDDGWSSVPTLQKVNRFAAALSKQRLHKLWMLRAKQRLTKPNETRWHGWLTLIEQAGQERPAYAALCNEVKELEQYYLSPDEWQLIQHTYNFLQPFKEVTKRAEGDQVTLDTVQEEMDFLRFHYQQQEVKHCNNTGLLSAINTSWLLFNKYYELIDEVAAYVTAILLHPSKRKAYLKKHWKKEWIKPGIERAKSLWVNYKERYPATQSAPIGRDNDGQELSAYELYQRQMDLVPDGDDFDVFIEAVPTKLAAESSAIRWWASEDQRAAYPALSQLAIDVLSALVMSAHSERTFSATRRTTSWERSRLESDTIERSECCKDWQASGLAYRPIEGDWLSDSSLEDDEAAVSSIESLTPPPTTLPSLAYGSNNASEPLY